MNKELNQIKKIYGEEMMHLCRELFPSLLEQEGVLLNILKSNIAPTRSFATDIKENNLYEEFQSYIYSFTEVEKIKIIKNKNPFELMGEAGYMLYECKSEDDIQSFRKYYSEVKDEVLCTIKNGGRLERCHVFFAVKKNVDQIKREDFKNPKREDEYGTSVISIQFSRGRINTLSIKNRYNHSVPNPDATFSNNLDNIIPGLKHSFEKYYGFHINQNERSEAEFLTDILNYIKGNDGRYYHYNLEINGIYYCENNIIIKDGEVITKYRDNKERYLLIDEFIIDRKNKTICSCVYEKDSFVKSINDVGSIESINVTKNNENKNIDICYSDGKKIKIQVDRNNTIIGYENNHIMKIDNDFLYNNKHLKSISLSRALMIGDNFLYSNNIIEDISLPQALVVGRFFLPDDMQITSISLPNVRAINIGFLQNNERLSDISLPNVQRIGAQFLFYNKGLISISLPKVQIIRDNFLYNNTDLKHISLPNVIIVGNAFLVNNTELKFISLPCAQEIGYSFLYHNVDLEHIEIPRVKTIYSHFLVNNRVLKFIELPHAETIDNYFLPNNSQLVDVLVPLIQGIGQSSLFKRKRLLKKIEKQITINTATEKVLQKVR